MSIDQLGAIAATFKNDPNGKPVKVVRIKFCGKYITLSSGKTVWRRIGDAKSAFIHHLNCYICYRQHTPISKLINSFYNSGFTDNTDHYLFASKNVKTFAKDLEKLKYVEYVVFEE